ncbi:hypothetical protein N5I18_26160, partial [Pseudomonas juntendi]|uniref:hypothetical protein n=1 Tax=Pseudomonas juntendi TaxID=2666183 RepID=UPI002447DC29
KAEETISLRSPALAAGKPIKAKTFKNQKRKAGPNTVLCTDITGVSSTVAFSLFSNIKTPSRLKNFKGVGWLKCRK